MNSTSKLKKNLMTLIVLTLSGSFIYSLPYFRSYYYSAFMEAFGLSNTQMGLCGICFGLIGSIAYLFGGVICDTFSVKKLIPVSMILTGSLGYVLLVSPPPYVVALIHGVWAFTSLMMFWPALMKAIRALASSNEQGRAFGIFEGGRGVINAGFLAVAAMIFGRMAAKGAEGMGVKWIVVFYSTMTVVFGIMDFILLRNVEEDKEAKEGFKLRTIIKSMRIPEVWLMIGLGLVMAAGGSLGMVLILAGCLVVYFYMYVCVSMHFAIMEEFDCPADCTGAAIGFICCLGYLPEAASPFVAGRLLDLFQGASGYRFFFIYMLAVVASGVVLTLIWLRRTKEKRALMIKRDKKGGEVTMNAILNHELPHEKYFEEICRYPHGSYNEQALSDYLVYFAKEYGLKHKQDGLGNVIIYKEGTNGYENHEPVIIQAHMDMICVKKPGIDHDFEKEPLELYIDHGNIRARGTSLGGDDGAGVAYMLAVLSSDTLRHPPIECLFTVQEEVGGYGAAALDADDFKGTRLICLDEMSGNTTTISGAGMSRLSVKYVGEKEDTDKNLYKLTVGGLMGGHSGDDIHKERGNANKITARLLYKLMKEDDTYQLASIDGGTVDNAISRECTAVIASCRTLEAVCKDIDQTMYEIQNEYRYSDAGVYVHVDKADAAPVFLENDSRRITKFLRNCPDGFRHRSMHLELTTASSNMGVIMTSGGEMTTFFYIRGAALSFVETIADEIEALAGLLNWNSEFLVSMPCWEYREDSPLREKLKQVFRGLTGEEMREHAEHGCLETGFFTEMKPERDIVTLGSRVTDYHTFNESIDRESFAQIYQVLIMLLEQL